MFPRAKVDNAASAGATGLRWFKIYHDGVDSSGQWGVDRMINSGGWSYFNMPSCVAPGNYLMRVELIALHSAGSQGGAQFYVCASPPPSYFAPNPLIRWNVLKSTSRAAERRLGASSFLSLVPIQRPIRKRIVTGFGKIITSVVVF